ncbi:hypothetical protein U9M48_004538, partial [Paspalum notatum var. saurae]
SSCGLFMINYMEYWTGTQLSDNVTQNDMENFRLKLIAILWELNTMKACPDSEPEPEPNDNKGEESSDEVQILDKAPNALKRKSSDKQDNVCGKKNLYVLIGDTLISEDELMAALHNYIKSIRDSNTLEKYWVVSSKPYLIALSLKTIQGILTKGQPMNIDCFNLALRKVAYEDLQRFKKKGRMVSRHYMDLKFCDACQIGKGQKFRTEIDILQIAKLVLSWPWIGYNVSKCSLVFIPCAKRGREATGYYVVLFMCAWDGKGLLSPVCTDAYELRKELLIHLVPIRVMNVKAIFLKNYEDILDAMSR